MNDLCVKNGRVARLIRDGEESSTDVLLSAVFIWYIIFVSKEYFQIHRIDIPLKRSTDLLGQFWSSLMGQTIIFITTEIYFVPRSLSSAAPHH